MLAPLLNGFGDRGADAAAFVTQQGEQPHGGGPHFLWDIEECGDIQRRESHGKPRDDDDARPDDLPRADFERQL